MHQNTLTSKYTIPGKAREHRARFDPHLIYAVIASVSSWNKTVLYRPERKPQAGNEISGLLKYKDLHNTFWNQIAKYFFSCGYLYMRGSHVYSYQGHLQTGHFPIFRLHYSEYFLITFTVFLGLRHRTTSSFGYATPSFYIQNTEQRHAEANRE